jgi:hypothetical protein
MSAIRLDEPTVRLPEPGPDRADAGPQPDLTAPVAVMPATGTRQRHAYRFDPGTAFFDSDAQAQAADGRIHDDRSTPKARSRRQALLVIGMHRSGTSALTRVINLHGMVLGSELMEAIADNNETGFWENLPIVILHDRLLAELGSSWDDPRELREGWLEDALAAGYREQLAALIEKEFGTAGDWAVKDPRLCRLLPLWLKVLADLDIEPKLIFALRHPAEVVSSLMKRDQLSAATASLLWLRHLAEPVRASRTLSRCVVGYNELLLDWCNCVDRIASSLAIEWPISSQACATEVHAHLRHDLRHQHSSAMQGLLPAPWSDLLLDVHATGLAVARGAESWSDFESKLDTAMALFAFAQPLMADLLPKSAQDQLLTQLADLKRVVEAQALDAMHLQAELKLIKSSLSWRWTRPARVIWRMIKNRGLSKDDQTRIGQLLKMPDPKIAS